LRADISELAAAIDDRTMLVAGSAPCYPYGVFDSIASLADLATAKRVWLHVDACLGGFLAPFARDEGYPIPEFDFSIAGVTSLSADLHKYGLSARGASVVLYRSASMHGYQSFHFENWPRGTYATDTFLGSRPGGSVASAWAVLQYLGRAGYRRLARKTMEAKQRLVSGIESIPGLEVIRPSELSILLFRSADPSVDIHAVADVLGDEGWFVGRSREPQALHLALNAVHAPVIDKYVADLRQAVTKVRLTGRVGTHDEMTY
jgi:glutamate/tyrosine decarboxylase-like PLP-dependent enzyme